MGTWDVGPWNNDNAADWAWTVVEEGLGAVEHALARASSGDRDDEELAFAAADLVATMVSGPVANVYGEDALRWATDLRGSPELIASTLDLLISAALDALDTLAAPDSALAQDWFSETDAAGHAAAVAAVRARIAPNQPT